MKRSQTLGDKVLRLMRALSLVVLTLPFFPQDSHSALAADYTWSIQTVDSAGDVGGGTSLAFDT